VAKALIENGRAVEVESAEALAVHPPEPKPDLNVIRVFSHPLGREIAMGAVAAENLLKNSPEIASMVTPKTEPKPEPRTKTKTHKKR